MLSTRAWWGLLATLNCAATPVFVENGGIVAALSVSGPSFRLSEDVLHSDIVPALIAAARRLSKALGFKG